MFLASNWRIINPPRVSRLWATSIVILCPSRRIPFWWTRREIGKHRKTANNREKKIQPCTLCARSSRQFDFDYREQRKEKRNARERERERERLGVKRRKKSGSVGSNCFYAGCQGNTCFYLILFYFKRYFNHRRGIWYFNTSSMTYIKPFRSRKFIETRLDR